MNNQEFRSGFVSIIGRTNVGKSSILNTIVKEKVSSVVNKPQTTRKKIIGILNTENSQIIFLDTPGIHKPHSKLGKIMNETAINIIPTSDVIIYVIDVTEKKIDLETIEKLKNVKKPIILIINKIDLVKKEKIADTILEYKELLDFKAIIPVSVEKNHNIDQIILEIEKNLKKGPKYYDDEEYTTQTSREIVEETIREKCLKLLQEEIPHGILVECTKMKIGKDMQNNKIYNIDATIYCVRESHKGMIIGKAGQMLKKIGTYARQDLERILDIKVNLKLWVKIKEDWINDIRYIKSFKDE